jgi:hypothetical protein
MLNLILQQIKEERAKPNPDKNVIKSLQNMIDVHSKEFKEVFKKQQEALAKDLKKQLNNTV